MAHDKAGKEEAEQRKDVKQSQAEQAKDQKKLDNLNEKQANKQDINVRHEVGKDAAAKAYNEAYENPENKSAVTGATAGSTVPAATNAAPTV
jgi:hypothetical protein